MELQNAYKQKMSAQLKEWSAQVNLLEAKVESAGAAMKLKRAEAVNELRAKQNAASEKMKELGRANGAAWEEARLTAEKIWDDLKTGIANTQDKFK